MKYCSRYAALYACRRVPAARSPLCRMISFSTSSGSSAVRSAQAAQAARAAPTTTTTAPEGKCTQDVSADAAGDKGSHDPEAIAAANKRLSENEGIFSKHGGKIVLGFLGALGLWFLRNHLGNNALDALKDKVEEACPLEPEEVEELRCANDYPPNTFRKVLDSARQAFPSGRATYPEFVRHVTSSGLLPEALVMGFLLDRTALAAAAHGGILGAAARGQASALPEGVRGWWGAYGDGGGGGGWRDADTTELDLRFLMVVFSAAVNTTPTERMQHLWELAQDQFVGADGSEEEETLIPASRAIEVVGMLMAAHQLPAGRYAVRDENRVWPVQQYRLASGRDAFLKGLSSLHEEEEKRSKGWIERKLAPKYDPTKEGHVSFELFERVMRSGPVCAWGECLGCVPASSNLR